MALTIPAGMNAQCVCIPLIASRQFASTTTSLTKVKPGFAGRVVGINSTIGLISGSTKPTDVDMMVLKGTTNLCSSLMAVVGSSAIVSGGAVGTLCGTTADLEFTATDIFHLDATVTAGSSPTIDDLVGYVFVVRE